MLCQIKERIYTNLITFADIWHMFSFDVSVSRAKEIVQNLMSVDNAIFLFCAYLGKRKIQKI